MPTVEVLLQLKLSAFTCRTDEAVSKQCDSDALFTHHTDAIKRCPSVHLPAEAKASRHHHGCLCGTSCVHTQNNLKLAARESGTLFGLGRLAGGERESDKWAQRVAWSDAPGHIALAIPQRARVPRVARRASLPLIRSFALVALARNRPLPVRCDARARGDRTAARCICRDGPATHPSARRTTPSHPADGTEDFKRGSGGALTRKKSAKKSGGTVAL